MTMAGRVRNPFQVVVPRHQRGAWGDLNKVELEDIRPLYHASDLPPPPPPPWPPRRPPPVAAWEERTFLAALPPRWEPCLPFLNQGGVLQVTEDMPPVLSELEGRGGAGGAGGGMGGDGELQRDTRIQSRVQSLSRRGMLRGNRRGD